MTPVEVLKRLQSQTDNFDSEYTKAPKDPDDLMDVDEWALVHDLTHEEKLQHSKTDKKYPVLEIYRTYWMYITELDKWVCVYDDTQCDMFTPAPQYVEIDKTDYLIDWENHILYKRYSE